MTEKKAHIHHIADNVAVALSDLEKGDRVMVEQGRAVVTVEIREGVPFGHKFALKPIKKGDAVTKYGGFIGRATREITPGEHVHVHNIRGVKYT